MKDWYQEEVQGRRSISDDQLAHYEVIITLEVENIVPQAPHTAVRRDV